MLRIAAIVVGVLCIVLALAVGIEERRLDDERTRGATAALAAADLTAERDSTRQTARVDRAAARLLVDSLWLAK